MRMALRSIEWICVVLVIAVSTPSYARDSLYLQIYPDQNVSYGTEHLYFGLMQPFGGGIDGRLNVLGVQVALDQINTDPSMLPGYTLHFTLSDSQVSWTISGVAL